MALICLPIVLHQAIVAWTWHFSLYSLKPQRCVRLDGSVKGKSIHAHIQRIGWKKSYRYTALDPPLTMHVWFVEVRDLKGNFGAQTEDKLRHYELMLNVLRCHVPGSKASGNPWRLPCCTASIATSRRIRFHSQMWQRRNKCSRAKTRGWKFLWTRGYWQLEWPATLPLAVVRRLALQQLITSSPSWSPGCRVGPGAQALIRLCFVAAAAAAAFLYYI